MRPESTSITNRPDLTVLSKEYDDQKAQARFIAKRAAPIIDVPTRLGRFKIFNRENFKKGPSVPARARGAKYPRITGTFGQGNFDCEDYGIEYPLDDLEVNANANLFSTERAATRILRHQTLLAQELRVAAIYSGAGLSNTNVTTAWTTIATAVPLDDIQKGIEALGDRCGAGPGEISMVIPRADFREMQRCAQVVDKSKYTLMGIQPGLLKATEIAQVLDIKEVLVGDGGYDTTEEGYAESNSQIWTAGVIYICVLADEGDTMEEMSFARTALWTLDSPVFPVIESYREEDIRSNIIRERADLDVFLQGETNLFAYKLTNT